MNNSFSIKPNINDQSLVKKVKGKDHLGNDYSQNVVMERPLTIFLNKQEVVTSMTVGDHPEWMAVGFLVNQGMLSKNDKIVSIDLDWESEAIVVRTDKETNYEHKIKKKIRTSGCAVGTMFGDVMDLFDEVKLNKNALFHTSWLKTLLKDINTQPSLYLEAGAIHSCILCKENRPLVYIEDVGRHNALDKIAGWLWFNNIDTDNLLLYTTGRLTSEMVIKTVQMHIPILISRSGFTAAGVDLAKKSNLTLIGRAKGTRFIALAGLERIVYD
ncbi:MAG: formate dehydrogenase family accessory protein FdhD [Pelagibacterales bacterium]|nr:formate dehydrogenase family accessory protein FdhD [Pelagibacterales bacterium]PPR14927.1 MAG: Sulfurtransferase FdhD [Alphaproteobacteria bacterium MarineAlpha9_Bin3]|tara:strand:+ start:786 stop:1598 length:813 start_codon:yes stop_codon:yes gene_type:complete